MCFTLPGHSPDFICNIITVQVVVDHTILCNRLLTIQACQVYSLFTHHSVSPVLLHTNFRFDTSPFHFSSTDSPRRSPAKLTACVYLVKTVSFGFLHRIKQRSGLCCKKQLFKRTPICWQHSHPRAKSWSRTCANWECRKQHICQLLPSKARGFQAKGARHFTARDTWVEAPNCRIIQQQKRNLSC